MKVVDCISAAVGDDIKEDIASSKLIFHNNTKFRIWDILYTKIYDTLPLLNCNTGMHKRGLWNMAVAFDNKTGILFTFMKEQRYRQLHNNIGKRMHHHYLDALAHIFNKNLSAPIEQLSLFEKAEFVDQNKMTDTVEKILFSLEKGASLIKNHVLILFDSYNFSLSSVRAIIVDSNLNVVDEKSWNEYIKVTESSVVDKVDEPNSPANNPSKGLKLTAKANARKRSVELRKEDMNQNKIG